MNVVLVERLWERVGEGNDLGVLGDFAFGPRAHDEAWLAMLFHQLPGARRHLVIGNHDGPGTLALLWDSVGHLVEVHDPMAGLDGPGSSSEGGSGGNSVSGGGADRRGGGASKGGRADISTPAPSVTLCHYPMLTWPGAKRGALQLFGHVHTHWPGSRNAANVGVDL